MYHKRFDLEVWVDILRLVEEYFCDGAIMNLLMASISVKGAIFGARWSYFVLCKALCYDDPVMFMPKKHKQAAIIKEEPLNKNYVTYLNAYRYNLDPEDDTEDVLSLWLDRMVWKTTSNTLEQASCNVLGQQQGIK
ncbi:hypothetical protein L228DRAFT_251802 [Xylona heveae TC161]|uniref:Uncharacterized protein n=1 Tax=Xylona heveae (strain CBS 132557 / TC161) TaxID=1328760 RepID=A0A164Z815_XYLHT|nr:hypothetical protein L228DRAFT_251802 [Xylona heveae TC161]KZF18800.1 hypothetical protein L228DRAFT_251802 [Xylona heveae TC161]